MSIPVRIRSHRLLAALLLGAFLATAPGASLLELAWHLRHSDDHHARAPHFEAVGGSAHADQCQTGLVHTVGRLPESQPIRLRHGSLTRLVGLTGDEPRLAPGTPVPALPRAPPALG